MRRYAWGVLYGATPASMYPDRHEWRDLCEDVAAAERGITEEEAAELLNQEFDFPVHSGSKSKAPVALHKKLRDAVHKFLDRVKAVALDAFLAEYHEQTGTGSLNSTWTRTTKRYLCSLPMTP